MDVPGDNSVINKISKVAATKSSVCPLFYSPCLQEPEAFL